MSESVFSLGASILLANGSGGWNPAALLLPSPVLLLRYRAGFSELWQPGADAPFSRGAVPPLPLLQEVLAAIRAKLPAAGPGAGKPAFPLAMVAAAYEFGRSFPPHEQCFPYFDALEDDEFFASIHLDAYRPDAHGGTERLGYAGTVPAGWIDGAPALATAPAGHDPPPIVPWPRSGNADEPLAPAIGEEEHREALAAIRELLHAGDAYQANFTAALRGRTTAAPEAVFDAALQRGGASFGALFLTPTGTIASFSPELFLRRRGNRIETRPIKGTREIPASMAGAALAREALESSAKDRAEHVMIVDLERNDLGRICVAGSVEAEPLMNLVEHPTVLHMESHVRGTLRAGLSMHEIFAATFPGGSVTGAPKKRAMEIIGGLEGGPRGIYCGALGWIDADGDCELNLPIRTAVFRPDGRIEYHAGGGIVVDSDPAEEWRELMGKVAFFAGALESAR